MDKKIGLLELLQLDCTADIKSDDSADIFFPKNKEGKLLLDNVLQVACQKEWDSSKFIVFHALNKGPYAIALTLEFWDKDNSNTEATLVSTIGLLPNVKTVVSFPLEALNSQNMFLERTAGKLKTVVHGNKVRTLHKMAIGKKPCSFDQEMELSNLHLTNTEPQYIIPDMKFVDEIGQWMLNDWPGKTQNLDELKTYLQTELSDFTTENDFDDWNEFGGWKNKKFPSTGFFRTEKEGQRWWTVDPEGCAFFSVGIDCIRPGDGGNIKGIEKLFTTLPEKDGEFSVAWNDSRKDAPSFDFTIANLIQGYGEQWEERWFDLTKKRLKSWGINTIGNWSSMDFITYAKMPYVLPLRDFPETEKKIFRDFPDVFSEEFTINSTRFASQLKGLENDKYMIGYFLRNEPTWAFIKGLIIAEELLENKEDFCSKDALIAFLKEKYEGDISILNSSWNISLSSFEELKAGIREASKLSKTAEKDLKAFSRIMIELYVKIPSQAVKKVDCNHLNLGMRYGYISSEEVLAGSDCFDVFSVNCYDINPTEAIEKIGALTDLPVMIGEYHFGALDRGLSATGIRAVSSQEERGLAYRYYLENAASNKYCVGAHYFQYNDQPTLGRFDGENYLIGLVDVCQKPYHEFITGITNSSKVIYDVVVGTKDKYNKEPDIIHPIFF